MTLLFASLLLLHPLAWFLMLSMLAILFLTKPKISRLALKIHRKTRWSWPLYFLPVGGGTTPTGPNTTIDTTTRALNEANALFSGGLSINPPYFQGALALLVKNYTAAAAPLTIPPGAAGSGVGSAALISGATVRADTLALPLVGAPALGGQDGTILVIFADTTSKQHTITTPANGIQGSLHIITMAAGAFSAIVLIAWNGSWWPISNVGPCVIS